MDKNYQPKTIEEKWLKTWDDNETYKAVLDPHKKPFCIILPLPNANDPMHMGHALFTIQDIMCRYHRALGDSVLWLPGADHAGIETQFVFEKHLAKKDQSRFDFDRETLYNMIWEFVEKNREINKHQLKRLGFSLDWSRYHYSLDQEMIDRVLETFFKLFKDDLIYRGERIVNYCPKCGTAFSDLEVDYEERDDFLYYLDYETIAIATARPETIFSDVAVAVNPTDKKYQKKLPSNAVIPLINIRIPVITDELVQTNFGTGALKVTPSYDSVDFEIAQKHKLETINTINSYGRLDFSNPRFKNSPQELITTLAGLKTHVAREKIIERLEQSGKLLKKVPLKHTVGICYRCKTTIEPMAMPQWYVKTKPLAEPAIKAVQQGQTSIFPKKRFEKMYFDWLNNIRDWNISRQVVWGPRIPVWYCLDCNSNATINFLDKNKKKITGNYQDLKNQYELTEIKQGLQTLMVPVTGSYQLSAEKCEKCHGTNLLQETDTFDTWFLSSQWPVNTLKSNEKDFQYFYPTAVLDTLWDIIFFWVARMMMMGLYLTGEVPFKLIHLHSRVVDKFGKKMSKSKGNVIDPLTMIDKYGADALRMALVMGIAPASDICLSEEKIVGMRNFCNKLWNIARFFEANTQQQNIKNCPPTGGLKILPEDKEILEKNKELIKSVTKNLDTNKFGQASEDLYNFIWHELADKYLESIKPRLANNDHSGLRVAQTVFLQCLQLLHPFMPFITSELSEKLTNKV